MKHLALLSAFCLGLATPAVGAEPLQVPAEAQALNEILEIPAAFGAALPDSALAGHRGKANISNENDLDGDLYSNNATNTVSGDNIVTEGALAGSTGLFTVIQNSGNNVLIQNATILNLNVQ